MGFEAQIKSAAIFAKAQKVQGQTSVQRGHSHAQALTRRRDRNKTKTTDKHDQ